MLRIVVDSRMAAHGNSEKAHLRESTRMAILAWCLEDLGHDVQLWPASELARSEPRWQYFHRLTDGVISDPDVVVVPSEDHGYGYRGNPLLVILKTTVSYVRDDTLVHNCDVLMAHEYNEGIAHHANLLPIWFLVSDAVIGLFAEDCVLGAYMLGDVEYFRRQYGRRPERLLGFVGYGGHGRKEMAAKLPDWADVQFRTDLSSVEYLAYLSECSAGVFFPGDTPKSYRLAELALMGVPIVTVPMQPGSEPPMTQANCIMLKDWSDHESLMAGLSRQGEIRRAADEAYAAGWGPMGQAKLLCSRLEAIISGSTRGRTRTCNAAV